MASSYLDCKKVETAINRAKKKLITEAQTNGVYENFGQKEVREIRQKFYDLSNYTAEMGQVKLKIDAFEFWCMNYTVR